VEEAPAAEAVETPTRVGAPTWLKFLWVLLAGSLAPWVALVLLAGLLVSGSTQSAGISGLWAISSAQSLFREGDKDDNGVLDYGTLDQLRRYKLIGEELGSGVYEGYEFYVGVSDGPKGQFSWWALARPVPDGPCAEGRSFFTNQEGVIRYSMARIYLTDIDPSGAANSAWPPVGQ